MCFCLVSAQHQFGFFADRLLQQQRLQLDLNVLVAGDSSMDQDQTGSRSASATSSLDPYYFGMHSESDDPIPLLPNLFLSATPDYFRIHEPVTPASNPSMIDRRGLVGVGELATPRWARRDNRSTDEYDLSTADAEAEGYDVIVPEMAEADQPDSPWTIEAVDGELSEREDVRGVTLFFSFPNMVLVHSFRFRICNHHPASCVQSLPLLTRVGARKFYTLEILLLSFLSLQDSGMTSVPPLTILPRSLALQIVR